MLGDNGVLSVMLVTVLDAKFVEISRVQRGRYVLRLRASLACFDGLIGLAGLAAGLVVCVPDLARTLVFGSVS